MQKYRILRDLQHNISAGNIGIVEDDFIVFSIDKNKYFYSLEVLNVNKDDFASYLFTTLDNVEVFFGDKIFPVFGNEIIFDYVAECYILNFQYFASEKNAQKYIESLKKIEV